MYATSAISRFNNLPREGYLKAVKRTLSYLKTLPKERIIVDTSYPDHSVYPIEDYLKWKELYPDAEENIPCEKINQEEQHQLLQSLENMKISFMKY
jgi:hypothetical protein